MRYKNKSSEKSGRLIQLSAKSYPLSEGIERLPADRCFIANGYLSTDNLTMETEIINRVANSGLVTLDLEEYYHPAERVVYDLKANLYMGLILKEKDFRAFLKEHDWSQYAGKNVAITCTEDAIVPTWAYMLLTLQLQPYAHTVVFGDLADLEEKLYFDAIARINPDEYRDARVVIKGCSKVPVPTTAYVEITRVLRPVVQSLLFGEPCSTVPLYKRPKT